ncbi:MAG: PadR family transcriptional regulator [Methanocellales archaeon]|nr:PadR family transcriptional regulator [Methanocellales archaeon]MDD3291536.1 PadR family transcriptional regulator [Methanocellales archaeon]MDD5235926.1 PadR family transcriptional regulator [Methanocellales archaeon]MDD5485318.1 PadR family transcriptional regulator [Methanocellales archaeon]
MLGPWRFSSHNGKGRGLLTLFVLHSLNKEPKSGYGLLKEMEQKTKGLWVPSKGTLYPILRQLEDEKLIQVVEKGKRSKNIFELTPKGKETLIGIREHRRESREKLFQFKNLFVDIFGEEGEDEITTKGLIFDMRNIIAHLPPDKKNQAVAILEKCLEDLKGIQ